jgi:hypothetical protein
MYQFFEHLVLPTVIHCSLHAVPQNRHTGMAPKTHRRGQVYLQELSLICTLMPLLAASHQFGPLQVAKGILTVALFCAPLDTPEPPSHQQSDSDDWDIPNSPLHNPSGDQSPTEPASPSLDALQNASRRIPVPPQQQQNPALRIAHWNACGLTERKWTVLPLVLERQGVDACVITETKWTYCSSRDYLDRSGWSCIRTDYKELPDSYTDTSKLQKGGVTLLLPPDSEISAKKLQSWQLKRITAATWQLHTISCIQQ